MTDRWFAGIPVTPETSPTKLLEELELATPSKAASGLRMAVNDLIQMSIRMAPDEVRALDADLAAAGLLTLTQVRVRYSKKFQSILKRGSIRTDVEYYVLQGAVADLSSGLDELGRLKAEQLCSEYESRASSRAKNAA